jgi:lipoprotein NlpD
LGELMLAVLDILALRRRLLIPLLAIAVLAGCTTTPNRAPVVEHSSGVAVVAPQAPVPPPPSGPGYYTVKRGDTLYGIALQSGQDYRQLAAWNNLDSSFQIRVGQVLRVAPPDTGNGNGSVALPVGGPGTGLVERPLGAPGAPGAAGATPPGYGPLPAAGDLPEKTGPSGVKRPYTDAALAELSKPDSDAGAPPPPPQVPAAGDQGAGDDENVGWIWPASGPEIAGFSEVGNKGVNIAGKTGAPVLASGAGTVLYVGNGVRGYGNLVVIKHNATYISVYAHNSKILVTEQQPIKKGQKIAEMGDSDADQVELHFEIRRQGKPVDPMKYLPAR